MRWDFVRRNVPQGGPKRVIDGVKVSTFTTGLCNERVAMTREHERRPGCCSAPEREEIRVGIETGESDDEIACRIGRHRSTVWREIAANGGRERYRAAAAEERAARAACRPKTPWTEERPWLWTRSKARCAPRSGRPSRSPRFRKEHSEQPEWWCLTKPSTRLSSSRPRRAAKESTAVPAIGPGSQTSSLASLVCACSDARDDQHLRTPPGGRRPAVPGHSGG